MSIPYRLLFILLFFTVPTLLSVSETHKFYVSVTQIDYVKEEKAVQIITRVFLDDLEDALSARYGESIRIPDDEKNTQFNAQIQDYFASKIEISINDKVSKVNFIGKSLEMDMMIVYLEIPQVKNITSITIKNNILFEIFEEQQNIIRTNINQIKKSFILMTHEPSRMLNF